jgi:hypothetical protein
MNTRRLIYPMMIKDIYGNDKMITPGDLVVKNQKYTFIMNVRKKGRIDVQKAAELNGYSVIFVDNASTMYADPLPDDCSVYMLQTDFDKKCSMDRLINTCTTISTKYKEKLNEKGYDVSNVRLNDIYLGCEIHENIPLKSSCD